MFTRNKLASKRSKNKSMPQQIFEQAVSDDHGNSRGDDPTSCHELLSPDNHTGHSHDVSEGSQAQTESSSTVHKMGVYRSLTGFDFSEPAVARKAISFVIRSRIVDFWPSFKKIQDDIKDLWYKEFKERIEWKEGISDELIRQVWTDKASMKYRELVHNMKEKRQRPPYIKEDIFQRFVKFWDEPEVKKIAQMNSDNRNSNPTLHRGGSKSTAMHRQDLIRELDRVPTDMEIYERLHKVEDQVSEDGTLRSGWVDERSRIFAKEYQEKLAKKAEEGVEITEKVQNAIFASLTKIHKKRAYGYGNQPVAYRDASYTPTSITDGRENLVTKLQTAEEEVTHLKVRLHKQEEITSGLLERLERLERRHGE